MEPDLSGYTSGSRASTGLGADIAPYADIVVIEAWSRWCRKYRKMSQAVLRYVVRTSRVLEGRSWPRATAPRSDYAFLLLHSAFDSFCYIAIVPSIIHTEQALYIH